MDPSAAVPAGRKEGDPVNVFRVLAALASAWAIAAAARAEDCNGDGRPDDAGIEEGYSRDCNRNLVPDECEVDVPGWDRDGNGIPDDCDPDCDRDGVPDAVALLEGASDCDGNGIPDSCDLAPVLGFDAPALFMTFGEIPYIRKERRCER